jgi:hypothetical protein
MGDVIKERPHTAGCLAAGGFDLDDIGPQVAHEFAAELALFVGKFQDSQARQRAWEGLGSGHCSISSIYA